MFNKLNTLTSIGDKPNPGTTDVMHHFKALLHNVTQNIDFVDVAIESQAHARRIRLADHYVPRRQIHHRSAVEGEADIRNRT